MFAMATDSLLFIPPDSCLLFLFRAPKRFTCEGTGCEGVGCEGQGVREQGVRGQGVRVWGVRGRMQGGSV